MHRTKSIVAALAAIALSETAVFAAGGLKSPQATTHGLTRAVAASGKTVPVRADGPDATAGARSPEATETPEANETPEATKSPDADATTGRRTRTRTTTARPSPRLRRERRLPGSPTTAPT